MIKILSNIFKGLLVALVIILTGGIFLLNVKISPNTSMVLVSSSLVNSIKTDSQNNNVVEKEKIDKEEIKNETEEQKEEIKNENEEKKEEIVVNKEEPKQEVVEVLEPVVQTPVETQPAPPSIPTPNGSYTPNNNSVLNSSVSATYTGLVTAYGPDCYGCVSGETASGYNVSNGNIYYNDPTYGTVRIVAGDRSLKFGTIVKISGLNISSEPVIAIVLDRGGDIGFNKPKGIIFDLLYTSEKSPEVLNFGMQSVTAEVLRVGY